LSRLVAVVALVVGLAGCGGAAELDTPHAPPVWPRNNVRPAHVEPAAPAPLVPVDASAPAPDVATPPAVAPAPPP
jgi:hypothetical protein